MMHSVQQNKIISSIHLSLFCAASTLTRKRELPYFVDKVSYILITFRLFVVLYIKYLVHILHYFVMIKYCQISTQFVSEEACSSRIKIAHRSMIGSCQALRVITAYYDLSFSQHFLTLGSKSIGNATCMYKTNYMTRKRKLFSFESCNLFYTCMSHFLLILTLKFGNVDYILVQ